MFDAFEFTWFVRHGESDINRWIYSPTNTKANKIHIHNLPIPGIFRLISDWLPFFKLCVFFFSINLFEIQIDQNNICFIYLFFLASLDHTNSFDVLSFPVCTQLKPCKAKNNILFGFACWCVRSRRVRFECVRARAVPIVCIYGCVCVMRMLDRPYFCIFLYDRLTLCIAICLDGTHSGLHNNKRCTTPKQKWTHT